VELAAVLNCFATAASIFVMTGNDSFHVRLACRRTRPGRRLCVRRPAMNSRVQRRRLLPLARRVQMWNVSSVGAELKKQQQQQASGKAGETATST